MLEDLKQEVFEANLLLPKYGLITFTWGNVSGIDRAKGIIAIKPSGVSYESLAAKDIILVDLDGQVVDGRLNPSSDTPTHLELYRKFGSIGGVTHTHSNWATSWAQAGCGIPAYGTTHADYFYGEIPCTRALSEAEIKNDYELNTGKVIVERFAKIAPDTMPAVLVKNHGPFSWGKDAAKSVENAVVLEQIAMMAYTARNIADRLPAMQDVLLDKHFLRKHGKNAYYGQKA